jgi:hypothetical protein
MGSTWAAGAAAVVLVLTVGLAGCGSDDSSAADEPGASPSSSNDSSSETTAPTDATPPTPSDDPSSGCPYLTATKVSAVLGTPTRETAGTINACFFDPEGGSGPAVLLSRVDVQIDPTDYARQSKQLCKGDVTEVDAGDVAFACVMGLAPQGQLYVGRVLVTVAVSDAIDDAAGVAAAAALLPEVTIPPGA